MNFSTRVKSFIVTWALNITPMLLLGLALETESIVLLFFSALIQSAIVKEVVITEQNRVVHSVNQDYDK